MNERRSPEAKLERSERRWRIAHKVADTMRFGGFNLFELTKTDRRTKEVKKADTVSEALEIIAMKAPALGRVIFDSLASHDDPTIRDEAPSMIDALFEDETEALSDPTVQTLLNDPDPTVRETMEVYVFYAGTARENEYLISTYRNTHK